MCLSIYCQIYLPKVKTGFKQITQGLLSETFVEAHVCRKRFARLSLSLSPSSVYLSLFPSVCHARSCIYMCVAKSQLLSYIDRIAPRSKSIHSSQLSLISYFLSCLYTTGRGSSGVGLIAAVMNDPITGEMTLGHCVVCVCLFLCVIFYRLLFFIRGRSFSSKVFVVLIKIFDYDRTAVQLWKNRPFPSPR